MMREIARSVKDGWVLEAFIQGRSPNSESEECSLGAELLPRATRRKNRQFQRLENSAEDYIEGMGKTRWCKAVHVYCPVALLFCSATYYVEHCILKVQEKGRNRGVEYLPR